MKKVKEMRLALILAAGLAGATGCMVYTQPMDAEVVGDGPPAPLAETVVAAPGPGFVWVDGYWGWTGGRWEWSGGHWARPPHRGAVWVHPSYYVRGGRHVYHPGHWR